MRWVAVQAKPSFVSVVMPLITLRLGSRAIQTHGCTLCLFLREVHSMRYKHLLTHVVCVFGLCTPLANAAFETTREQTWTLRALITELEDTHFVDKRYNDKMSRAHLQTYLERLDPSNLYFTESDVEAFSEYQTTLDDLGRKG